MVPDVLEGLGPFVRIRAGESMRAVHTPTIPSLLFWCLPHPAASATDPGRAASHSESKKALFGFPPTGESKLCAARRVHHSVPVELGARKLGASWRSGPGTRQARNQIST